MACPVCERPAEEIHAPAFRGRVVRCNHCREFAASADALDRLAKSSYAARQNVLKAARRLAARRRTRPLIDDAAFDRPAVQAAHA